MSIYDSTTSVPIVVNFNSKDRISGSNSNFTSEAIDIGILEKHNIEGRANSPERNISQNP